MLAKKASVIAPAGRPVKRGALQVTLAAQNPLPSAPRAYELLKGKVVIRSADAQKVDLTTLWSADRQPPERAAGSWQSSSAESVKPELDKRGVKLFLVSIGTHERSKMFVEVTGFPETNLFVDPENITYTALGLAKNVRQTFFDWNTPLAFKERIEKGKMGDLAEVMPRWQPWIPPKQDQAFQQGGMLVFEGDKVLFSHQDPSTSAHADLEEVKRVALSGLGATSA